MNAPPYDSADAGVLTETGTFRSAKHTEERGPLLVRVEFDLYSVLNWTIEPGGTLFREMARRAKQLLPDPSEVVFAFVKAVRKDPESGANWVIQLYRIKTTEKKP